MTGNLEELVFNRIELGQVYQELAGDYPYLTEYDRYWLSVDKDHWYFRFGVLSISLYHTLLNRATARAWLEEYT